MKATAIARIEAYLQSLLGNQRLRIDPPKRKGAPVEVRIGGEFLGTLHCDEEDGEVSFSLHISIWRRISRPPHRQ